MSGDTIAAVSTPPGRGGIGVVRVSGPRCLDIVSALTQSQLNPQPRYAHRATFSDRGGDPIDHGVLIYFPAPHSYTGEDVVELQAHGSPLVLHQLLRQCCEIGARPANAGEFTERAFRNGKLDLAQAEAVADLIASQSERAARAATRTLTGDFARAVTQLVDGVQLARAELEAAIDFADDVMASDLVAGQAARVTALISELSNLIANANRGVRLSSGAQVAIIGAPNVGKSSLLNQLSDNDRAIVSDIAGTTRDVIDTDITISGIPIRLIDTAGLRHSEDPLERAGIARTQDVIGQADLALLVTDSSSLGEQQARAAELDLNAELLPLTIVVHNKIDLADLAPSDTVHENIDHVFVSALTGSGISRLRELITQALGVDGVDEASSETEFIARDRHLDALNRARAELKAIDLERLESSPELAAEHYRTATDALYAIGGQYTTEDLLGDIFSRFCIGK